LRRLRELRRLRGLLGSVPRLRVLSPTYSEKLVLSTMGPLQPDQQTLERSPSRSASGQTRTHAVHQSTLFDHHVGAREQRRLMSGRLLETSERTHGAIIREAADATALLALGLGHHVPHQ
jgi:hypothetical protein